MTAFATRIRPHVQAELATARALDTDGFPDAAFTHLERAHVLGQAATVEHVRVHWAMLRWALRHRRAGEAVGQLWRTIGAALLTWCGWVPAGNTGGSNVSGLRPMPVPPDLARVIAAALVAATLTACVARPPELDLSLRHASAQGHFVVRMEPPSSAAAINQMHAWQVELRTPDGAPVRGARIAVDGGMPEHGHGLPTRPQVTRELQPGTYLVEGMKFSMAGWWELKLAIASTAASDTVVFNTLVGASGARP